LKWVLLIRHLQSEKNIEDRFAKASDPAALTSIGRDDSVVLGAEIASFRDFLGAYACSVHCSSSRRSLESAQAVADALGTSIEQHYALDSFVDRETSGMDYGELMSNNPGLARRLNLYRAGIFNSYNLIYERERLEKYEASINEELDLIVSGPAQLLVVVAHRSALTSALIGIARKSRVYPVDFFGYVPIDLGAIALAAENDRHAWSVVFANLSIRDVNGIGRALVSDWLASSGLA